MGGYFIPKELQNKKSDIFIFSFIKRTKLNLDLIKGIEQKESEKEILRSQRTAFEVTQLLNSLMGFIVFPMESFLQKAISDSENGDGYKKIDEIINNILTDPDKYKYENDYKEYDKQLKDFTNRDEVLTRSTLIRHMRNAMCHENLSIQPMTSSSDNIRWITFADYYPTRKNIINRFSVRLSVEEVRTIALSLCDELLDVAYWTYGIDLKNNN